MPVEDVPLYRSPDLRIFTCVPPLLWAIAGSTLVTAASVFLNAAGSLTSALRPSDDPLGDALAVMSPLSCSNTSFSRSSLSCFSIVPLAVS